LSVSVSVSNDARIWSDVTATYIYQDMNLDSNTSIVTEEFDVSRSSNFHSISEKSIFDSVIKLDHSFFRNMSNHVVPDFNIVDARGFTPLHYSAVVGDVAITHFLLMNNAFVNARDPSGNTPLHWAVLSGNRDLIPLLVYFGTPVNLPNFVGETPLHLAISTSQNEIADLLIQLGANVNASGLNGNSPLHYASVLSNDSVSLLLQNGAYANLIDADGESPLHWAARECMLSVIHNLLEQDAYADLCNEDGESPLHLAITSNDSFFINDVLNLSKFDINLTDNSGATPIQIALESGLFSVSENLANRGASLKLPLNLTSSPSDSLTFLLKKIIFIIP